MPQYDYSCETHGNFEAFARMSECENPQPCPECGAEAPRVFVAFSPREYLEKLVVFRRPDGTYSLPLQRDAIMPPEYERVELKETADKRRVEREIDREHRENWERSQIGKQMLNEGITAQNRSELRNIMANGGRLPDGRTIRSMSAAQKDFARFAINQNNNKPREKYRGVFHFEALSQNASNREDGRGRDGQRIRK